MSSYVRRLPVYLLVDCSESMAGPAIEEVERGLRTMIANLMQDPMAIETIYVSVITFSREVKQIVPLTDLVSFKLPQLQVRTGTAFGAAIWLLLDCLKRDVVRTTATTKGDYRPIVVILTDGQPTDEWQQAATTLRTANDPRPANVYAVGCGPDVDFNVLYRTTDIVLKLDEMQDGFKKFFVWLSASVKTASLRVGTEGPLGPDPLGLIDLPAGVLSVPANQRINTDKMPRQVFLHAVCSGVKKPYLMRYLRDPEERQYRAVAAHPLPVLEDGDAELLPPINSSLLRGVPRCPYCLNPGAGLCGCGTLFCSGSIDDGIECPGCHRWLSGGSTGSFDIDRVQG